MHGVMLALGYEEYGRYAPSLPPHPQVETTCTYVTDPDQQPSKAATGEA